MFSNIFPGCLTLLNCTAISSNDDDYTFELNELTSFKFLELVEDVNIEFHVVLFKDRTSLNIVFIIVFLKINVTSDCTLNE